MANRRDYFFWIFGKAGKYWAVAFIFEFSNREMKRTTRLS